MFNIPKERLAQPAEIPAFWVSDYEAVNAYLAANVRKGEVRTIGTSAGGRAIRAVFYGTPRQGKGTTTFSGSLGFRNAQAFFGPDYAKRVFLGMGAVHGGEFEGIVGLVNLVAVLETGKDLRGKEWPELTAAAGRVDRIIVLPILNVDGRVRIPLRMESHTGTDHATHEYLNTGGKKDGSMIGWPQCKEHIPLDFATVGFPGGYPNDAGVNVMHDDFLGSPQPETRALLDLCALERPDLVYNLHTGAPPRNYYLRMHRPFGEAALQPVYDALYRQVHGGLAREGLQSTKDPDVEADPARSPMGVYNLDTALNLHCGALSVTIESPSHGFSGTNRAGVVVRQTPEMILDAQLVSYQEGLRFLAETGGRSRWTAKR